MMMIKSSVSKACLALFVSCLLITPSAALWHTRAKPVVGTTTTCSANSGGTCGVNDGNNGNNETYTKFHYKTNDTDGSRNLHQILLFVSAVLSLGISIGIYMGKSSSSNATSKSKTGRESIISDTLSIFSSGSNNSKSNKQKKHTPKVQIITKGFDTVLRRMNGADVAFDGIQLQLTQKVKKGSDQPATRMLLDGSFRGRIKSGRMVAIMGPSGAGKSVFLHALAGRIKADSKLALQGDRYLNGQVQPPDAVLPAAFVEQEVNFFPRMTVRETLAFRVALHYGDLLDKDAQQARVNDLLSQLGLDICADTIVGDQKVRGISSGERKRLSIAVEMISSPDLVCCDEPTSNLDSTAAAVVVDKLRQMAVKGKTILCVIHQPSAMIFSQFDDVLLVSQGKQMYFGPVFGIRKYMEDLGYLPEDETGTPEFILDCVSPIPSMWEIPKEAEDRLQVLAKAATKQAADMDLGVKNGDGMAESSCPSLLGDSTASLDSDCPRTSMWTQFKLLLQRAVAENFRGKDVIMIKTTQQAVVAIIYGAIYSLGHNQASILDRFGLLSLTSIGGANMAIATALRSFPKEKTIAGAEIAIKQYRALPYFAAKAISELPLVFFYNGVMGIILFFATGMNPDRFWTFLGLITLHSLASEASGMAVGAVSPSSEVALAVFPAILILNVIFDGRNISIENTPFLLRWIPKVSLIRWGFEGLVVNEFEGLEFDATDSEGPAAATGKQALAMFGMDDASVEDAVQAEATIMIACWCLAYLGLTLTKQRFVTMQPVRV